MLANLKQPDERQLEALLLHVLSLTSSGIKANILDWSEQNIQFPHSDRCPTFDRDFAPWFNQPLQDFASGNYKCISFLGPTGCGKSSFLESLTTYVISQDPGPTLIIGQSDDDIAIWAEDRLMPMLDQIAATKVLMPHKVYAKRKTEIIFPHMPLRLGGANINNLQSKSCRYVMLDEVWTFQVGMVKEAIARLHDRSNGILVAMGQAGIENDEHNLLHDTTQKYEYSWLCPACKEYNTYSTGPEQLIFDETKDERGQLDRMALARSVRLKCPLCATTFVDNEFNRKLLSLSGKYLPVESNPWPNRIGFHMHVLGVWWIRWAEIALERASAIERMRVGDLQSMRQFKQKREAMFWSEEEQIPKIQLQAGGYGIAQYANAELIEGEGIRFLTIDRQMGHFWAAVRAWTPDGASKLLYADKISDWSEIPVLQKKYKILSPGVAIDCRYDSAAVYSFCATNQYIALRGDRINSWIHAIKDKPSIKKPYSPFQQISVDGKVCVSASYSNLHIKDILNLLRMGRLKPFEVPNDIGDYYGEHMASEVKKDVTSEKGEPTMRWINIKKRPNHLFDCETMQTCLAVMFDIVRLDENFQVEL